MGSPLGFASPSSIAGSSAEQAERTHLQLVRSKFTKQEDIECEPPGDAGLLDEEMLILFAKKNRRCPLY